MILVLLVGSHDAAKQPDNLSPCGLLSYRAWSKLKCSASNGLHRCEHGRRQRFRARENRVSKMYAIIIMNVRTSNSSPVLPATSHHEERDPCKYSEDASYSAPYTLPGTLKMRKHLRYRYDVAFGSQQATARQRHRVTWLKINIIKLLP